MQQLVIDSFFSSFNIVAISLFSFFNKHAKFKILIIGVSTNVDSQTLIFKVENWTGNSVIFQAFCY